MAYDFEHDATIIKDSLECINIGSVVMMLPVVDSTNNFVKKYSLDGVKEGFVAIAEYQTKGRGRAGRFWHSPPETGIYLSTLLKPPRLELDKFPLFTLLAGVAAVSTINEFSHQRASLKWPNDIVINGKKVCGLLCELMQKQTAINGLVIGVGINANHLVKHFPEDLKDTATSLRIVNGSPIDRIDIIRSLLMNLDREYQVYLTDGKRSIIEKWSLNTELFGKKISINRGPITVTGTAIRLNDEGRLVLRRENGNEEDFDSGEVSLNTK